MIEALVEITTNDNFNADSVAGADSLLNTMLTFKFLLSVKIWNHILHNINICNLTLQKQSNNLAIASKKLEALLSWLKEFRINGFEECLSESSTLAEDYDIDINSGFIDKRQTRGVNRKKLGELSEDIAKELTNLQKFKLEFFNELLDNLISEMSSRFAQLRKCEEDFGFLWGAGLSAGTNDNSLKCVKNLRLKYPGDFDESKFNNDFKYIQHQISALLPDGRPLCDTSPLELLQIIYQHELESCFPNVACALQFF